MCEGITREEIFEEFIRYRVNYNWWSKSYQYSLNAFKNFCTQHFPEEPLLIQDMLNRWYEKKPTERRVSMKSRTQVVTTLVRYIQKRYNTSLYVPELPKNCKTQYTPHSFSDEELTAFFRECDSKVLSAPTSNASLTALTISMIFRTLYSTGMRTTEVRLLKIGEINFQEGVVSITSTKGNRQHFVALDHEMNELLYAYHKTAERFHPARKYFFYNKNDNEPFSSHELHYQFEKIWKRVSSSHAVPYDLRHNYAVQNINRWISAGIDFHDKFLYLSKSMGHSCLESTKYYYHLVPLFANIMYDCDDASFDAIVPEVYCFEED